MVTLTPERTSSAAGHAARCDDAFPALEPDAAAKGFYTPLALTLMAPTLCLITALVRRHALTDVIPDRIDVRTSASALIVSECRRRPVPGDHRVNWAFLPQSRTDRVLLTASTSTKLWMRACDFSRSSSCK